MIVLVQNKDDKHIMEDVLWGIGFDIFYKIDIKVGDISYHSIHRHIMDTILSLQPTHMFFQQLYMLTPLSPSNNHYLQQSRWGGQFTPVTTKQFQFMFKNEINKYKNEWIIPHHNKYLNTNFTFWFEKDDRDANNYFKVTLDVGEYGLYKNDKRTIPSTDNVFLQSGTDSRQLLVTSMSEKIGIFNNIDELHNFIKNNCNNCRRSYYNRKCTDFYNTLENRLSLDVIDSKLKCNKIINK